jgi:uncharacterized protein (UPF0261 family)
MSVLLISTLDTKRDAAIYLKNKIEETGERCLLMDISMGKHNFNDADISAGKVAEAGGSTIEEINNSRERAKITQIMTNGITKIAKEHYLKKEINAVVGIGGSTGTLMISDSMQKLPFGLPKLIISSTAALPGLATRYIGKGDIMLFHSVVEIAGLSELLKNVLDRAAFAVAGMNKVKPVSKTRAESKKAVALSMFGICEKCATFVREMLEATGKFEIIGFSAAGVCDRAMEEMILDSYFDAVIDLAPGGVGEYILGGMRAAGPDRLENAGKVGIPMVIAPSGVNVMSPSKRKYKPDYYQRKKFDLDKHRTMLRVNADEMKKVAEEFARKLNKAAEKSKVVFLFPLKGWSSIDYEGSPIHEPETDKIFIDTLKKLADKRIVIKEYDLHLEDEKFANKVVEHFLEILE